MKPKIKATCTKLQLQLLSFCLLCLSGKTRCDGNGPAVVTVEQNSDAVLPCSLSTKENIEFDHFVWKKAAQKDGLQKEVFYYDAGITYDRGRAGQSEEFKGRVSYFEGLSQGNASIIIRNTTVTDSGNYTCDFPLLQPRQTFHIKLVVKSAVVTVEQDEDALLPCSRNTENIEQGYFYWYKVAQNNENQKEVFLYEGGRHSNNGYGSQDVGFRGRVSHFQEELKRGNASIMIRTTKMADSGTYTCTFTEPHQMFHIELVVGPVLKDRSGENNSAPKPFISTLEQTKDRALLQCVVRGASPKSKVEWKDSSGNKLPAEEPQVTDRGGSYDIILQTTVTKTDHYHCVVTQEEINHQTEAKTHVYISGAAPEPSVTTLEMTKDWSRLQCVVRGASPKPKVEWKDSSGNKLPAKEPQVTDRGGSYDIILRTTVTKTDYYHCVVTQEEINHQTEAKTHVYISGPAVVTVEQDSDAVLPCSLSTKENIDSYHFDWKKAAQKDGLQKEVFYYDAGIHYNNGLSGQSEEFKGRVSHFEEGLTQGNASIIIRNTTVTDSGSYTCDFPHLQPPQTFHIKLVVESAVVRVKEDEDALLPCSRNTENIEQGHFDWNKVAQNNENQKEVFLYEGGRHSNNGFGSQDNGFKDRVSHFQEELKRGNASIMIRNTKMADNGTYTCTFTEPRQTFHIELVVDCVLKDRSGENNSAPKPFITILEETNDWSRLQCVVRGASPKPKVEWKDSSGNKLPAEEPQVTDRGGSYDIILRTTVTKTDHYHCVVTQEENSHQSEAKTHVYISGNSGSGAHSSGFPIVAVVVSVLCTVVVGGVALAIRRHVKKKHNKGSPADQKEASRVPLNGPPSRPQEALELKP